MCKAKTLKKQLCRAKNFLRGYCKRHTSKSSLKDLLNKLETGRKNKKYIVLTGEDKHKVREYYKQELLKLKTKNNLNKNTKILDRNGNIISNGIIRIVIGDHGGYLEFNKKQANLGNLQTKKGQEYRRSNVFAKYEWLETPDKICKIYKQKGTVKYADYKKGFYYVDPFECNFLNK